MIRHGALRAAAAAFAVLLLAGTALPPAAAAGSVYFTAINETILPLSDSTMPFWSDGYLYVSSSTFSGGGLGIYYSHNTIKQTVVLYMSGKALIYRLDTGIVSDNQGNNYWPPAVTRGSHVFLPVSTAANYFGLTYTCSRVSHGYLVRIRSSNSLLSDSLFVDAAHAQLASRYSQYQQAGQSSAETPSPAVPASGTQTETAKEDEENAENAEPPGVSGKMIHLCFRADAAKTAALTEILNAKNAAATIYFTELQIRKNGDLVRQVITDGQSVGLIADASAQAGSVEAQLHAANSALFRAAAEKTRLCMVDGGSAAAAAAAQRAGYCCLNAEIDRSSTGLRDSRGAKNLLRRIAARSGAVTVWLSDSVSGAGLNDFLSAAGKNGDKLTGLTELTA